MDDPTPDREKLLLKIALAAMGLGGLILMVAAATVPHWATWWDESAWWGGPSRALVEGVGIAALTAALLGFTVDRWLKTQLLRDVFRAAIGHFLPDELREAVRWVTTFRLMGIRTECLLDIEKVSDQVVKVTCEINRVLKNASETRQKFTPHLSRDDWGIPGYQSELLEMEYELEGQSPVKFQSFMDKPKRGKNNNNEINLPEVHIDAGKTVRTYSKYVEYCHINDLWHEEFHYPSHRPEIRIRSISPELDFLSGFGHHAKPEDIRRIQDGKIATLPGTLMPHQRMSVHWWPRGQFAASTP